MSRFVAMTRMRQRKEKLSALVVLTGAHLEAYTKRLEGHNLAQGGPIKCQCGDHRKGRRNDFRKTEVLADALTT